MSSRASALLAVAVLALAGCGLKGPLYSPDEKKEVVGTSPSGDSTANKRRTPPVPPAPQAQKKESATEATRSAPSDGSQGPAPSTDPDRPADSQSVPPPDR